MVERWWRYKDRVLRTDSERWTTIGKPVAVILLEDAERMRRLVDAVRDDTLAASKSTVPRYRSALIRRMEGKW